MGNEQDIVNLRLKELIEQMAREIGILWSLVQEPESDDSNRKSVYEAALKQRKERERVSMGIYMAISPASVEFLIERD